MSGWFAGGWEITGELTLAGGFQAALIFQTRNRRFQMVWGDAKLRRQHAHRLPGVFVDELKKPLAKGCKLFLCPPRRGR